MASTPSFAEAKTGCTGTEILPIKHNRRYYSTQRSPLLAQGPDRVGHFSLTGPLDKREPVFHDSDMRSLHTLNSSFYRAGGKMQPIPLDREDGRTAVQLGEPNAPGEDKNLNTVLMWILAHRSEFNAMRQSGKVRFVSQDLFRRIGVMRSVSYKWKYERGWLLAACRFQGVIYIAEFPTNETIGLIKNKNDSNAAATAAGRDFDAKENRVVKLNGMARMFQHVMNTPQNEQVEPLNINEKFSLMMLLPLKSALTGNYLGLLYRVILSGYDEQFGGPENVPGNCYGCRTVRKPATKEHIDLIFKTKYPDWWTKCYAAGERGVIVGCYDKDNALVECKEKTNADMLNAGTFEPADIIGGLRDVLEDLAVRVVKEDCDKLIYLLRWPLGGAVPQSQWRRSPEISVASVYARETAYQVLPKWFTDEMAHSEVRNQAEGLRLNC